MKKTSFKFGLLLAMGLTAAIFYSCKKDDDNGGDNGNASKITATNVINSSSIIAVVKAELSSYYGSYVLAEAQYKNNGFTLELPTTVSDNYLTPLTEEDMQGVTVSDKTVCGVSLSQFFLAYDKGGNKIGELAYASAKPFGDEANMTFAVWLYVDKNLTVKGQNYVLEETSNSKTIINVDWNLKKGWNIIYESIESHNNSTGQDIYTVTFTSRKPSGTILKWYYDNYNYGSYAPTLKLGKMTKRFYQLNFPTNGWKILSVLPI